MRLFVSSFLTLSAAVARLGIAQDFPEHNIRYECDPCIDRGNYKIRALYHGDKRDEFWHPVEAAAIQAGRDFNIDFEVKLYDNYSPEAMAADVEASITEQPRPDAVILTLPDPLVVDAVEKVVAAGIPVIGLNSGYKEAPDLGFSAFVAQDEYLGGAEAAKAFLKNNPNIQTAAFVNHAKGVSAVEDRRQGFEDELKKELGPGFAVNEIVVDGGKTDAELIADFTPTFQDCNYDIVLLGGLKMNEVEDIEQVLEKCTSTGQTVLGTFDVSKNVYEGIQSGRLLFGISQQPFLQGKIPVLLAMVYVTTGKLPAPPVGDSSGTYLSGPQIVDKNNVPSDTLQTCTDEGFPICPNTKAAGPLGETATCDCIDTKKIRLGGVLHGVSSDEFWHPVFAAAENAAKDMGVTLELERFDAPEPGQTDEVLHDQMAQKIEALCNDGVDGLFVTIPSERVIDAIKKCQQLNVNVVSVNSGADFSEQLGLVHHVGQLEYQAGFQAGKELVRLDITKGWCVNHEPENVAVGQRCAGMQEAFNGTTVVYGGQIDVPRDNDAEYQSDVETAISDAGSWAGYGLLLVGQLHVGPATGLLGKHPDVIMGTFDLSPEIYEALDAKQLKFGIDQQPYLQGYFPVPLLTYLFYAKQHLQNEFIESGPAFIFKSPTEAEVKCEDNDWQTCNVTTEATSATMGSPTVFFSMLLAMPITLALLGL